MNKVLAIGIDSLAPELLVEFEKDLPHFTKLRQESTSIRSSSVFPVDSVPAWASIFTGVNPAKHGILYSFDIFESTWQDVLGRDIDIFRGKTFWDYAGNNGKKVCVLFPLLAYPPWQVNGIMISRSVEEFPIQSEESWVINREIKISPPEFREKYQIPHFMKITKGRPPRKEKFRKYIETNKKATLDEAELALRISQDCEWDLFFVTFSWLDIIQHFFWRYQDENDPTYPGSTPYKDVIKDFYKIFDKIIRDFMDLHPDATTIIFSDHGHTMRPPKTVNINEILREKGLLKLKAKKISPLPFITENLKRKLLDFVRKYELDYWLVYISKRFFPTISKEVYMSSRNIDLEESKAYLSSFAGPKSYRHGGLEIKRENLKGIEYEELRNMLIEELSKLTEPSTGEKLIDWVCRREELYQGSKISLYPDIVFELREGYGVYWGIYTPLIGTAYEHNLASGGHKKEAVFLISNSEKKPQRENMMTVMDIAPTILDILGINVKQEIEMDGTTIFKEGKR